MRIRKQSIGNRFYKSKYLLSIVILACGLISLIRILTFNDDIELQQGTLEHFESIANKAANAILDNTDDIDTEDATEIIETTDTGESTEAIDTAETSRILDGLRSNDPKRLCTQNPFANYLSLELSSYANLVNNAIEDRASIEESLIPRANGHDHVRFEAFQEMGACKIGHQTCLGGTCRDDESKIICGLSALKPPCVIYSIGGNNKWKFEQDALAKTSCDVHTFDCTGKLSRFEVPMNNRMHFHHVCLGTKNLPGGNDKQRIGEVWTIEKMQKTLGHAQISLVKIDIEGFEWPIFQSWNSSMPVLPMQIMVEVHYKTQMKSLFWSHRKDWKNAKDLIALQMHLLDIGYATVVRDNNKRCPHCVELTLVRVRCP